MRLIEYLALDYPHCRVGRSMIVLADCFEWLSRIPANGVHAVVTDPPFGVREYDVDHLARRSSGNGGAWRIPPSFDGHDRAALPRFADLSGEEREQLRRFFVRWARAVLRVLRPGGHVFVASNAMLSQVVFAALVEGGLEYRSTLVRVVRTLRGGDRPKGAEEEFPGVCSLPRCCYEPWGIFRKPIPRGMTVSDCLRAHGTGGLRRTVDDLPFEDVIVSERTPRREREIADHPSLKPQSFLRRIVHASLPLGEGIIVDPFSGSGSTVAAAEALGLLCVGVECHADYYALGQDAAPRLAGLDQLNLWGAPLSGGDREEVFAR